MEKVIASVNVLDTFRNTEHGMVLGCEVTEGTVKTGAGFVLYCDGLEIASGKVKQIRRYKEVVEEVAAGLQCGIVVEQSIDAKAGHVLKFSE